MRITQISKVAVFVLTIPCTMVASAGVKETETEPTQYKSDTKPDALSGNHGDEASEHYFSWVSDVEHPETLFDYMYLFKNDHAHRTLTAEWLAAGMKNTRFGGYGKYTYSFQSSMTYREDDQAIIRYGPGLQHTAEAPTYVKLDKRKAGKPKLKSRITLSRILPLKDDDVVDLQFESFAAENRIHVSVCNTGNVRLQPFVIPELHSTLQTLRNREIVTYQTTWPVSEKFKFDPSVVFEAPRGSTGVPPKKLEFVVQIADNVTIEEKLVRLIVLDPYDGTRVTEARITVYIPRGEK